jgi:GNAT superfamily N-acetyltransferase
MTDDAQKAERREIADTLVRALERRHELLDVIVESEDYDAAVEAIAAMLGTTQAGGEAVLRLSFDRLTKVSRRRIRDELTDLNHELSFTMGDRQPAAGESLTLRLFSADADRDIFASRTDDVRAAGDGSGAPAGDLDDEIRAAVGRVHAEEAVWLVAIDGADKVGMVFGELVGGEVNVRIWIHPDHRHRGFGTAALRRCRSEMAAHFPAVPMVVRAPGAEPK